MFRAIEVVAITLYLLLSQISDIPAQERRRQIEASVRANTPGFDWLQLPEHTTSSTDFFRLNSTTITTSALSQGEHKTDFSERTSGKEPNKIYFQTDVSGNSSDRNLFRSATMLPFTLTSQTRIKTNRRNVTYGNGFNIRHRRQDLLNEDGIKIATTTITHVIETNSKTDVQQEDKERKNFDISEDARQSSHEEAVSKETLIVIRNIIRIIQNIIIQLESAVNTSTKTAYTTTISAPDEVTPISDKAISSAVAKMIKFASNASNLFSVINSEFPDKVKLAFPFRKALLEVIAIAPKTEVVEKAIFEAVQLLNVFKTLYMEVVEGRINFQVQSTLRKFLHVTSALYESVDLALPSDVDSQSMRLKEENEVRIALKLLEDGDKFDKLPKVEALKKATKAISSISKIIQKIIRRLLSAYDTTPVTTTTSTTTPSVEIISRHINARVYVSLKKLLIQTWTLFVKVDSTLPDNLDSGSLREQQNIEYKLASKILEEIRVSQQLPKHEVAKKATKVISSISKIIQNIIKRLRIAVVTTTPNATTFTSALVTTPGTITNIITHAMSNLTKLPTIRISQTLINNVVVKLLSKLVSTVFTLQETLALTNQQCKETGIKKYANEKLLLDKILTFEDRNKVAMTAISIIRIEAEKLQDIFRHLSIEMTKRRANVQLHSALMKLLYQTITLYENVHDGLSENRKNESMRVELKNKKTQALNILQEVREFKRLCKEEASRKAAKVIVVVSILIQDIIRQLKRITVDTTMTDKSKYNFPMSNQATGIYDTVINDVVIKMINKIVSKVFQLHEILASLLPVTAHEQFSNDTLLLNSSSPVDKEVVAMKSITTIRVQAKKLQTLLRLLAMEILKRGNNVQLYGVLRKLFNILPEVRAFHQLSKQEAPIKAIEFSALVSTIIQNIRKRLQSNRTLAHNQVKSGSDGNLLNSFILQNRRNNLQSNRSLTQENVDGESNRMQSTIYDSLSQKAVAGDDVGCPQRKVATSSEYNLYHIQKGTTTKKLDPGDLENPSGFRIDGLDKVSKFQNMAVALEFAFKRPILVSAIGFTTAPNNQENGRREKSASVKLATVYLEKEKDRNTWSPVLNDNTKKVMLFNLSSNTLHSVPQSNDVLSGIRLYPQQWDSIPATVGRPVFIYCSSSQ